MLHFILFWEHNLKMSTNILTFSLSKRNTYDKSKRISLYFDKTDKFISLANSLIA